MEKNHNKIYKFYYIATELDNNFQSINLYNNSHSLQKQISIGSGKTFIYKSKSNKNIGEIYFTFTNYGNKIVVNGTIDIMKKGSIFFNFITEIIFVNGIPIIPTGTIIKVPIISGSDIFLGKKGLVNIEFAKEKRNIKIIIFE